MRTSLALVFVALIAPGAVASEPTFRTEAIFPAERKHNHASCVVELAGGDLMAAWYTGGGEKESDDVRIEGARLKAGDRAWGPRTPLADEPGYPDLNPALFAAPDRTVWMFWPTILDHRWEGALLKYARTDEGGNEAWPPRWTKEGVVHVTPSDFGPAMARAIAALPEAERAGRQPYLDRLATRSKEEIYQRLGWMPRVHPTVLASGRWLLPIYSDTFDVSIILASDDRGATWATGQPMIGFGNIQPSLVAKKDGTVVAFMRDAGPHHKILLSTSADQGRTWSPVTDSTLPNPGAGVEAIRLANGHWALIYNDTTRDRYSLVVSLSLDEGATWPTTRPIERVAPGQGSFHYPSILQGRDGTIHITYTRRLPGQGSTIQHAQFNEEWLADAP